MTFILAPGSKSPSLDWNGDANITFSAPTVAQAAAASPAHNFAGMVVADLTNLNPADYLTSVVHKINGNVTVGLTGALYLPKQELQWEGNSDNNTTCLQVIAAKIMINGNMSLSNACPSGSGLPGAGHVERVRLVE